MLKYLENNKSNGCSVHGISYIDKRKNIFIRNDNRKTIENLDALPFANRTISKKAIKKGKPIEIGILAQRGCPFPCSFCNGNRFLSNEYPMIIRRRSPANVVDEMELLHQIIYKNRSLLRFYDATFITRDRKNRQWIETFCSEIERRNLKIPFDVFVRANSFNLNESNDISLISRLKSIGMISTYIGLESGSDSTLEKYNKKVDVNESKTMFNFFKSIGINGSTNGCMTFQQESTIIDIIKTVEFLYEIRLCSFWNCLTRAETLPGIRLNIINRKRETPWDVYNYAFCDNHVDKLYSILYQINKSFPSIRIEDRLTRLIRDRIKIEMFWDEHNIDWIELNNDFELIVKNLQGITHDFIINIAHNIDCISMSQIDEELIGFIKKYDHYLMQITQTYSWILNLQPITNTGKGEYEKCN